MNRKHEFQKFLRNLKQLPTCHLSSDEEWPTLILQREEIFPKNYTKDKINFTEIPSERKVSSSKKFLEDDEINHILKRKINTTYVKNFVDKKFASKQLKSFGSCTMRHSSLTRYLIKDLVNTEVMEKLLIEEKKWVMLMWIAKLILFWNAGWL